MTFPYKVTACFRDGSVTETFCESRWGADIWADIGLSNGAISITVEVV